MPQQNPLRARPMVCLALASGLAGATPSSDALDVEQDAMRIGVERKVVEDLAEIDIGR